MLAILGPGLVFRIGVALKGVSRDQDIVGIPPGSLRERPEAPEFVSVDDP